MGKPEVDINQLTEEERLDLIERLWASLSKTTESLPLSDAQRAESIDDSTIWNVTRGMESPGTRSFAACASAQRETPVAGPAAAVEELSAFWCERYWSRTIAPADGIRFTSSTNRM